MSSKFNVPIFKALLAAKKIRQWQVANAVNCDSSYLSKICQGKLIPKYPLISKIAMVLGVKAEELIMAAPSIHPDSRANLKTRGRRKIGSLSGQGK